ncbi:GNAT family N-acetyltransferase [Sporosarcina sp. ACRSL]|uniref:GNAT family N-acetyltransferase n=1 Tax=Sporosarcina sp. ACRSL TaxID=2918215 RepID=UPI001EF4454D|nr:N-acetyltransferase [Sporosarcina sp. ACRSL]MCG7342628.1 GNAT family N-acetyltransferase [Sporosarcina sp. ACRSL]
MNIVIEAPRSYSDLAAFLAKMNKETYQHIGYCGESKEEIYDTLTNEFSDLALEKSFIVAYKNEDIAAAIGLDINLEDRSAEVWGPFVSEAYLHTSLGNELWEKVTALSAPQVDQYSFFFNLDNLFAREFANSHGGQLKGFHTVLVAKKSEWNEVVIEQIKEYNSTYQNGFAELHGHEFPSTYYSAKTILKRLSEENQLFISTSDNELTGYVYIEADPLHGDGSIEYIAVSEQFRKQGIGKKLLTFAVNKLFAYEEIEEITLSVNNKDEGAIKLYQAVGFKVKHKLIHYEIDKKEVLL